MAGWPDLEELKVKETSELAIRYWEGLVYATIADRQGNRRSNAAQAPSPKTQEGTWRGGHRLPLKAVMKP
jgi:hypothetical protein